MLGRAHVFAAANVCMVVNSLSHSRMLLPQHGSSATTAVNVACGALVLVFVFLLIAFQIKVERPKGEFFQAARLQQDAPREGSFARGQLTVYSLAVQTLETSVATQRFAHLLEPATRRFQLPRQCPGGRPDPHTGEVTLEAQALLVCDPNHASHALKAELLDAHVTYGMINNKVYLLRNIPTAMGSRMADQGIHGDVFVLTTFRTGSVAGGDNNNNNSACAVLFVPFLGSLSRESRQDLLQWLVSDMETRHVQVVAYSV